MTIERYVGQWTVKINEEVFPVCHSTCYNFKTNSYEDTSFEETPSERWLKHIEFVREKGAVVIQKTDDTDKTAAGVPRRRSQGIMGVWDIHNFEFDGTTYRFNGVKRQFMRY
jgi:hypothetical protein